MKVELRNFLLEEGLLDSLKNNWGKIAVGGATLAAADSGALGDEIQSLTHSGMDEIKKGMGKTADYYANSHPDSHPDGHSNGATINKNLLTGEDYKNNIDNAKNLLNTKAEQAAEAAKNAKEYALDLQNTSADQKGLISSISNSISNGIDNNIGKLGTVAGLGIGTAAAYKYAQNKNKLKNNTNNTNNTNTNNTNNTNINNTTTDK